MELRRVLFRSKKREAEEEVGRTAERVKQIVEDRATHRRDRADQELANRSIEVAEARGRLEVSCSAHPKYQGETRRTSCQDCNIVWQAHRAVRKAHEKEVGKAKGRVKKLIDVPVDPDRDME